MKAAIVALALAIVRLDAASSITEIIDKDVSLTTVVPSVRPPEKDRKFQSASIDKLISSLTPLFENADLGKLFENCLPNTLDTTVYSYTAGDEQTPPDSFIITGDIEALWLRDSTNQVLPYVPYIKDDPHLMSLVVGLINRQAQSLLINPFANSYNIGPTKEGHQDDTTTPAMSAQVFEAKYEIDSPMAFLKLSYWVVRYGGEDVIKKVVSETWLNAVELVLETLSSMQNVPFPSDSASPYLFQRETTEALDTLMMDGLGPPSFPNGLSRSLFRPSDDAVTFPYHIPGNYMACVEIRHTIEVLQSASKYITFSSKYGSSVDDIIDKAKRVGEPICSGKEGAGIGGPHVGFPNAWPMSIIVQAMTSSRGDGGMDEVKACLDLLLKASADTGLQHESFNVNDVHKFTRKWFAWVNGLFGELILQTALVHPTLLFGNNTETIKFVKSIVKTPISLQAQLDVEAKA